MPERKPTEQAGVIMKAPKDYIVFPLDMASIREAARYIELLSDSVGMFKVGLELFVNAGPEIVRMIQSAGRAEIFLDLKFHDIPATVERATAQAAALGVKFLTVHCGETPRMLAAAVAGADGRVEILGVTVLTSVSSEDLASAGFKDSLTADMTALVKKARANGESGRVCRSCVFRPGSGDGQRALWQKFLCGNPGYPAGMAGH